MSGQAYRTDCWRCGYRRTGLAHDAPCPECGMTREEARDFRRQLGFKQAGQFILFAVKLSFNMFVRKVQRPLF